MNRHNNFDLIRLYAAVIVFASHLAQFNLTPAWFTHATSALWSVTPGVPIFFLISGFLITSSWLSNPNWTQYIKSRLLRIFPAYLAATILVTTLLALLGYLVKPHQYIPWFFGTITTLYPYHTPTTLRPFSGDMPNGSTWTIPVELEFYLMLPPLLWLTFKHKAWLYAFTAFGAALMLTHDFGIHIAHPDPRHMAIHYFWIFGLGIAARLEWDRVSRYFKDNVAGWSLLHTGIVLCSQVLLPEHAAFLITTPSLLALVLSAAFSFTNLSHAALRGKDYSYGLYLFHAPWIHTINHLGLGTIAAPFFAITLSLLSASLSWHFIEKPSLAYKRHSVTCKKP